MCPIINHDVEWAMLTAHAPQEGEVRLRADLDVHVARHVLSALTARLHVHAHIRQLLAIPLLPRERRASTLYSNLEHFQPVAAARGQVTLVVIRVSQHAVQDVGLTVRLPQVAERVRLMPVEARDSVWGGVEARCWAQVPKCPRDPGWSARLDRFALLAIAPPTLDAEFVALVESIMFLTFHQRVDELRRRVGNDLHEAGGTASCTANDHANCEQQSGYRGWCKA